MANNTFTATCFVHLFTYSASLLSWVVPFVSASLDGRSFIIYCYCQSFSMRLHHLNYLTSWSCPTTFVRHPAHLELDRYLLDDSEVQ
ncbi:uncharacterized protein CELE_ZK546.19 [Caenorhabditis elegans]|uniref:Secreted protein n=1 Tax=Caenorhabditis elegans TaxID=6239 RepID=E1B6Q4_CAEEL|nr:Secreted protein [Caenorhabditis elegans]CCD73229.1 Secreted protein [Caenorhabditis elegans]|eukprot:NP_001254094.1 Uncharacterized protein CELE_ZK546.19 [Caenorhabditis elegans]